MPDEKIFLNYRPGDTSFILKVPFDKKERAKRIGGVWDQTAKGWRFPVDTGLWEQIRRNFGGKGDLLVDRAFLDKIAAVEENQRRFEGMRRLAEEDSPIDFAVPGVALDGKNPLFNYQKWGVKCAAMAEDGFLIGDQPGLGKTAQALAIAILRRNRGEISNCLIICPASLKYNWLDEIAKFTRERALVIDGTAKERRQKWMAAGYFFKITNYETIVNDLFVPADPRLKARKAPLPADEVAFRKYMQGQYAMVCCDEIHALKHFDSQRTQAVKQLRARYRLGLSGTPIDGRLEELHSIFQFLKPGLFENRRAFLEKHAQFDPFGRVIGYFNVQEVRDRISPYYLRRLKEKVLQDLPPKLFKDVYVELKKPEMGVYKDLIQGSHEITEEAEAITRIMRVRQFLDFPEIIDLRNPSAKFLALADLLEELVDGNREKALIFTQYKQVLDRLVKNLAGRYNIAQIHGDIDPKERVEIVKRFNDGPDAQILIGTDAMSTGLNIGGAHAVIHYEDNFSPALMQQRNDRAHRATTRHNVTIYRFICKGTIEEHFRRALGDKMELNNRVLDENCTEFGTDGLRGLDLLKYL
ncbi:MAG: DEAD/DEAH box helicase [Victivallales bacterium]|nr:DEAD/DEAH box helicase [Victivallales bacterium]